MCLERTHTDIMDAPPKLRKKIIRGSGWKVFLKYPDRQDGGELYSLMGAGKIKENEWINESVYRPLYKPQYMDMPIYGYGFHIYLTKPNRNRIPSQYAIRKVEFRNRVCYGYQEGTNQLCVVAKEIKVL